MRSIRRALTTAGPIVVLVLTCALYAPAASADEATRPAAVSCSDGSRGAAADVAATGQFVEHDVVHSDGTLSSAEITLRYSKSYECAWGLLETSNGPGGSIWIERSSPWDGNTQRLGQQNLSQSSTTHTGAYDAQQGSIRACGYGYDGSNTTRVGVEGANPVAEGEQEFTRSDIVCTDWVTADTLAPTF